MLSRAPLCLLRACVIRSRISATCLEADYASEERERKIPEHVHTKMLRDVWASVSRSVLAGQEQVLRVESGWYFGSMLGGMLGSISKKQFNPTPPGTFLDQSEIPLANPIYLCRERNYYIS